MTVTILFVLMFKAGHMTMFPPMRYISPEACANAAQFLIELPEDDKEFTADGRSKSDFDEVRAVCITPKAEPKGQDT